MNIFQRLVRSISSWQTRRRRRPSQQQQQEEQQPLHAPDEAVNQHGILYRAAYGLLYIRYLFNSAFFNTDHANASRIADTLLEPLFWFIDNYTHVIGPAFVVAVFLLTSVVVSICYYVGLPWWWNRSPTTTVFLVILGNWLLLNVSFHYFMATFTEPGKPPEGIIANAYGICKKCIAPKPPRTHHCSVCKCCVLKVCKFKVSLNELPVRKKNFFLDGSPLPLVESMRWLLESSFFLPLHGLHINRSNFHCRLWN